MAIDKITKKIKLDLKGVKNKAEVKAEIGEFVVNEMLEKLSAGKSPVVGEEFEQLNKKYADANKGGNQTPNLELFGDMLDALTFKNTKEGIEVGIFKKSELDKADGHNKWNWSNNRRIPKRRFIPKKSQEFVKEIKDGIKQIVQDAKEERPAFDLEEFLPEQEAGIRVDELFGDDFLDAFLREEGFI